ncbi:MAG: hypothetical protein WB475_14730, partial [Pseudolabrys sp.]
MDARTDGHDAPQSAIDVMMMERCIRRKANAALHHHHIDSGLWRVVTVVPGIHCRSIQLQRNTQCQFEIANF